MKRYNNILFVLSACIHASVGQNLDKISKKDLLKISGGMSYQSTIYATNNRTSRRPPFVYSLSSNLNASVLGISFPFVFNYTNNTFNYSQPAAIKCVNPTYKYVRGTFGVTSMNFSPYSVTGHLFTGGGLELTPQNFKISALYGVFKRAVPFDFESSSATQMSFRRTGYGVMAGYQSSKYGGSLTYFSAEDLPGSLSYIPGDAGLSPKRNTVISAAGKLNLVRALTLEGEFARSKLINMSSVVSSDNYKKENALTNAYKLSLHYRLKNISLALNHEHVDPEYTTFGAYFINNDFENYTISSTGNFMNSKLTLSANVGIQRNNLSKQKLSSTRRIVGATSLGVSPAKNLSITFSYNNFSTVTQQQMIVPAGFIRVMDTLAFYNVSRNVSSSLSYGFGQVLKQNFSVVLSLLESSSLQKNAAGEIMDSRNSVITSNGAVSYNLTLSKRKTQIGLTANINKVKQKGSGILFFGPTLTGTQPLLDNKIKLNVGLSYNRVEGISKSEVWSGRFAINFQPKLSNEKAGKINFNISTNCLINQSAMAKSQSFNEFTGTFGVNYNFN